MIHNKDIRAYASNRKVKMWQIAEKMGIADSTLCRHLRTEFPDDKKVMIRSIIDGIKAENEG